ESVDKVISPPRVHESPPDLTTPRPQPVLLETKTVYITQDGTFQNANKSEPASPESFMQSPLPVRQKDEPDLFSTEESNDNLLETLQNAVRETYLAFMG